MKWTLLVIANVALGGCLQPSGTPIYQPFDTTPPTILSTVPVDGATGVHTGAFIQVVFSKEMDDTTTAAAVTLVYAASGPSLPLNTYDFDEDAGVPDVYQWFPVNGFQAATAYVFTIRHTAQDSYGNSLIGDTVIHFQTAP